VRILVVYLGLSNLPIPKLHHGIASLSAVLKGQGHQVGLLYLPRFDNDIVTATLREYDPDLIGLSFISPKARAARQICQLCARQRPGTPIVLGGIHPTLCPAECIRFPGVTAITIGEAEESLLEFVAALDEGQERVGIAGLWLNHQGWVIKNPARQPVTNLDDLPFADRELFDHQREIDALGGRTVFMTGRGCPYRCAFCANEALGRLPGHARVRRRGVGHVIREIEQVTQTYKGIRLISFQDDTFTLQSRWLEAFCATYARRFDVPFIAQSRADTMTPHVADLLAGANCIEVRMGVETGDDRLRNQVLGKGVSREQIADAFATLRARGIKTLAYLMLGVPYETRQSLQATYDLCAAIQPDAIRVSTFQPFPGTPLRELCQREGWLDGRDFETLYDASVLNQPGVTQADLDHTRRLLHRRFPHVPEAGMVGPPVWAIRESPIGL
jgi:anaerobic magnesium-protoporphyrin IX monomethyl ester cyclase